MKKVITLILLIIASFGCSNIKIIYKKETLDTNDQATKYILNKLDAKQSSKSVLFFTTGFKGDSIELKNENNVIFNLPIETLSQLGLAHVETISNEDQLQINIQSPNPIKIFLNESDLKKYKFIYISKSETKRHRYLVEYSNRNRDFY